MLLRVVLILAVCIHFQVLDVQEVLCGLGHTPEQGRFPLERAADDTRIARKFTFETPFKDSDQFRNLPINGTVDHNQVGFVDYRQIIDGNTQIMRIGPQNFLDSRIAFFVALDHQGRIDVRQPERLLQFAVDSLMGCVLFQAAFVAARALPAIRVEDAVADFTRFSGFAGPQFPIFDDACANARMDAQTDDTIRTGSESILTERRQIRFIFQMHVEGIHILQLDFQIALQRIVGRENNLFLIDEAVDRNAESDDAVRGFLRMLH